MSAAPVFLDHTGRRWRRLRRGALVFGIISTMVAFAAIAIILVPPLVPQLPVASASLPHRPELAVTKRERLRLAKRMQLWFALRQHRPPPATHARALIPARRRTVTPHRAPGDPIIAGFYVNWDDNSRAALAEHADDLDWVVCEWGFVARGGDSLQMTIDPRVPVILSRQPEASRPQIFLMVENYDSATKRWDAAALRHLLTTRAARTLAVRQLTDSVVRYGLAGVTIDFEEVPMRLTSPLVRFEHTLRDSLAAHGRLLTQAVSINEDDRQLASYAAVNDKLFLMLYDEHYSGGDPGPVASQTWFEQKARRMLRLIPPNKAILTLGAYGYDWNDGDPTANGAGMTFQEVMAAVREAPTGALHFDPVALNPYATWSDADSTDHVSWYLDAVTAYDEMLVGRALGAAGTGIWRLGAEDPAIWNVIGRHGIDGPAQSLATIPAGYDPEFQGTGEILEMRARPTAGHREVRVDSLSHLIVDERVTRYATPYIMRRFGASAHRVALTFDDGPDGRWTPAILDTLRSRHAPATFFVIGQNAEAHIPLIRRMYDEGHELGSHTFTHPNLALTTKFITRLELDATQRLLEAILDRRPAFFRPPYFGDAEPTTADELVPVGIASDRGYLTVGLHIDSEDWTLPGVRTIIDTTLAQLPRGNVILLHDGGGNRAQTVAALGPLIDSLHARGDTLVLVSELIGVPRGEAMPPLPARGAAARLVELASFGTVGVLEWVLYWVFLVALVIGMARLCFITALALVHRVRRHQRAGDATRYAPSVSVIVPAYNEERVIVATVQSLITQAYAGELDVVVVDDGSPDATYATVAAAFHDHPRVAVYQKPNGGKASALNYGLHRAQGEIVICLDADTVFTPDTVAELVAPLADPAVGAVAGNAKVGNRVNLVTRWQAIEYVTSQNLDRRAFSLLDCITVVPGAVGAWRRELVERVGGFSDDTLAEDQDLTLAIRREGYSIAYADAAVGYTEAPDTVRALAKQRFRWSFGTLQCAWKHRDVLFRPRGGSLGLIALPNVWIFQLLFPVISPVADLMFLWSLVSVWLVKEQHGATYALTTLDQVLLFYALFLLVDWAAAMIAFLMEPEEDKALTWLVFLQRFVYRQVMYWVVVRSFLAAVRGHVVGWGKLERKATVEVPAVGL